MLQSHIWALRHKTTGAIFPTFTYKNREAARKAAKGRRFGGKYTPVKIEQPARTHHSNAPITRAIPEPTQRVTFVEKTSSTFCAKTASFKANAKSICSKSKGTFPIAKAKAIHSVGSLVCQ